MRHLASKRYAKAFLQIAIERSNASVLQKQLDELAEIHTLSDAFKNVVTNPSVRIEERRSVVKNIAGKLGWDPMTQNLALLLVDKDRIQYVSEIAEEFGRLLDEHEGRVRARVVSARALAPAQQEVLKSALASLTGKSVVLKSEVDESLLGGVVTHVGNTVYDGSVRTHLNKIRESILEEV